MAYQCGTNSRTCCTVPFAVQHRMERGICSEASAGVVESPAVVRLLARTATSETLISDVCQRGSKNAHALHPR